MKPPTIHISVRAVALGLLVRAAGLSAQTPAVPVEGETVKLTPFEVNSESIKGYGASESMTGSRVAMQIIDLPYTVNVLTNDFTKDFGMFELADNITQVSNFTGLDIGGNFMLRGFNTSQQLRDGFLRAGRYGSSNIDRIEVIKGSNAAISALVKGSTDLRGKPVLSTFGRGCQSLRNDRYRYNRYRNGAEELYDHSVDPHEFRNLADDPAYADAKAMMRKFLPTTEAPEVAFASAAEKAGDINRWDDSVFDDAKR